MSEPEWSEFWMTPRDPPPRVKRPGRRTLWSIASILGLCGLYLALA